MAKKAPNPTDKHVGNRVRMRRLMLGLSQEKLGDALDLTFQQVQKYEKGTNRIGASRLQQIGHVLQVPASYFFEDAPTPNGIGFGKPAEVSNLTEFLATSDGQKITKAFMRLNHQRRRHMVNVLESLVKAEAA